MGKWDKYKKKKDNKKVEDNTNKTNINWLRTIYSNFIETPLFIRGYED